jgi:hypothetical protein
VLQRVDLDTAVALWLAREGEHAGKLVIKTKNGTVVCTGTSAKNIDVAATTAALMGDSK